MNQSFYGLLLFAGLLIPPVARLMESIMIVHMHMQMPMLVISGFLMAHAFQTRFPRFFDKWNQGGLPGILLFGIITIYWMIPRTMDEAITMPSMELFKFVSLPFLAGIPLRDSWKRLGNTGRNVTIGVFTALFFAAGFVYLNSNEQLCNSYLLVEQITLGWGFLLTAVAMTIYLLYVTFVDREAYEGPAS